MVPASEKYQKIIESVVEQFLSELDDRIHSIVLFGSVARGEATEESDIDLLVILSEPTFDTKRRMNNMAATAGLETGVFIEVVHFTTQGFERETGMRSWFSSDIVTEGIVLYDDGTYRRIREADSRYLTGVSGR